MSKSPGYWQSFATAMSFLTVIPGFAQGAEPAGGTHTEDAAPDHSQNNTLERHDAAVQGSSLLWYPLVGAIVGVLLTVTAAVAPGPPVLQAALILLVWVVLSGGLHLDGLADCSDAWLGGLGDRELTLALLKDPLCGSMAVIGLVLTLLLKYAALVAFLQAGAGAGLWFLPALARAAPVLLFLRSTYVRAAGVGTLMAQSLPRRALTRSLVLLVVVGLVYFPWGLVFYWFIAFLVVFFVLQYASERRLQGFTGDVAGAMVELQEVALLMALCCYLY